MDFVTKQIKKLSEISNKTGTEHILAILEENNKLGTRNLTADDCMKYFNDHNLELNL